MCCFCLETMLCLIQGLDCESVLGAVRKPRTTKLLSYDGGYIGISLPLKFNNMKLTSRRTLGLPDSAKVVVVNKMLYVKAVGRL